MSWLNYHHLLYFWTVAKEGGVTEAAEKLRLAQPTLSSQIRSLELSLGTKLFEKRGRRLALTDAGRTAFRYADEIFGLGKEMQNVLAGRDVNRTPILSVGISDALPKLMVKRLLEPALKLNEPLRMDLREDRTERLLTQLSTHEIDLVLADQPLPAQSAIKAFSHLLGECGVVFFGAPDLRAKHSGRFPNCLNAAPVLLPAANTAMGRALDQWFESENIRPKIIGRFDDSALMKTFAQSGHGFFAGPEAIAREIERQYQVKRLGAAQGVREQIYALSLDRRLRHPAVIAISESAKLRIFA
jgi:LysR family transcriptional regulator, transcriptional activator of nhaA